MNDPVTAAIVEAAIHVPEELLAAGAAAVENSTRWSASSRAAFIGAIPATNYRELAERIAQAWSDTPDLAGAAVAAAMRTAAVTAATVRSEHNASLVWTGPSTEVEPARERGEGGG